MLFAPPLDLLCPGPLDALRTRAVQQGRWILVNIQSEKEFQSHVLNRDIWSSKRIREQLKGNFLLWQQCVEQSIVVQQRLRTARGSPPPPPLVA